MTIFPLLQATAQSAQSSTAQAFSIYGVLGVPGSISLAIGALTTSFWLGVKAYKELTHNGRDHEPPRRAEDAEARLERRELVDAVVNAHANAFSSLRHEIELTREVFTVGIERFVTINERRHQELVEVLRRVELLGQRDRDRGGGGRRSVEP